MKKLTMSTLMGAMLLACSMQVSAATEVFEDSYSNASDSPDGTNMLLDAFVAKPVHAAMVVGGFFSWVAAIPFSVTSNSYKESWVRLVEEPAVGMQRCLGCTPAQDDSKLLRDYQRAQYQQQSESQ